ncbi:aspartate aminotransferase family protein [Desertimonas flava]|uniref:aspartate aminotransferase family protein n=1 Tax=Desertimonas flava TaxID=2064846 RepID=UPI000E356FCE|nr:aminotransferase class III-fold pyridoxal phosphate-dependent enzyme [Desertimonas flava]
MTQLAPVWATTTTLPIVSGSGCWVTTDDGRRYLDFTAGIAVASTGHCHPKVVAAIQEQAATLIHGQVNCYRHDLLDPLARRLGSITPDGIDTFFYANSGAEITEAAVKLAKAATGRGNVVVFAGSFHGRTHLAMAMTTSKTAYKVGYTNLPPGVFVAPFPDVRADVQPGGLDAEVDAALAGLRYLLATQTAPSDTAAVVLEPVIGEGGYLPAPPAFFRGVAEICREHDILFVADEVQTGFGRTGTMFAVDRHEVVPDILMMAKGIASGMPLSALGASAELMSRWPTGSHGGTYGGNPIACAAALATIDVLSEDGFLDNVEERGAQLRTGLQKVMADDAGLIHVRGLGLMNAVEFADPARCKAVIAHLLDESRVITMAAGVDGATLRWMPPLVVSADEIDLALAGFAAAVAATA